MDDLIANTTPVTSEIIRKIDELNEKAWKAHITQPKLGLELSTEAKSLSEEYFYPKGRAYAIRNMGVSHRYLSNLETALSLSRQALELFAQMGEKTGEAQAYVSVGSIYYYLGDYERSLDYFLKGLRGNEETGNKEAQAYALNGAGYIYGVLGDNKKGLEFLQKALIISKEIKSAESLQLSILDSLAVAYLNNGQIDKAHDAYLECLYLSEQSSHKINMGYALFGIGKLFVLQNMLNEAKSFFSRSLDIRREISYKVGEANCLLQLGKVFLIQEDIEQAKDFLLESLKVAENIKANAVICEVHESLAELYELKKDFQSFTEHYKLYHKYKSEVFKDEQESKQKYLSIQFEMDKLQQEAEINRLTNVVMRDKNIELEKKTEELEQSYNSVSILSKIGRDITSTLNLETILTTVYENVNELMDASIFGIGIYNEDEKTIDYRLAIEKGIRYQPYQRTMDNKNQFPVWCIEHKKEVFINDVRREYARYISEYKEFIAKLEDGTETTLPVSLIYLPLMVKDKIIGLLTVQSFVENAYTPYHLEMLKTLASYTAAALYNAQSFETLQNTLEELKLTQEQLIQKLSEVESLSQKTISQEQEKQQILASQNETLERQVSERTAALIKSLEDLTVTQSQLIQSEKMASLGELTAGIAHEIQNPLNFVNNFSEVNKELLVEMKDEMDKGNISDAKEIANDVIANEEKINHHGKRADAIVKGMLQHSRRSNGIKEPTDINALCDEYLRLSYHGLRAKDKSFNATMKTDFDESIEKINIIPQDVGRVILNLITNAFYAVTEKKTLRQTQGDNDYEPTVTVCTKKLTDKVEIRVIDNGNGIPQKILDKIFQPFFTTKPTGQGTGLGLSLSYDIVKAHGGELKVETMPALAGKDGEGQGTEFIILLPLQKEQ